MNLRLLTLIGLMVGSGLSVRAQNGDDPGAPRRTPEELRELLGPIALYPDPLISLILPASTAPSDVVLAARFVKGGGDPEEAQDRPWDPSVRALTRYPDTLTWMDENLEWTTQVGDAFIAQPVDVMDAVQQLRAKARNMGNLVDTPQQTIVEDDSAIRIVPAQPEYVYEPRYDPQVVYYERPAAQPLLYFGAPLLVGSWLAYDCDWGHHRLYRGEWRSGWDYHHDRDRRERESVHINNRLVNALPWHVDTKRRHEEVRRPVSDRPSVAKAKPVISRPTSIIDHVKHKGGEVRRAEPVVGSKGGPVMGSGRPGDKSGKGSKFPIPSTPAPFVKGDGKPHSDSKGDMGKSRGDSGKPHGEGSKSTGDPIKGISDMVKPKSEAPKSRGSDSPKPHFDAPKPKSDSPKPKGDSPKPHFDAPKPKSDSPKPKGDSPKPHFDAPKPKSDSPKPKGDSPKPHFDAPKPKMEAPKPKPHVDAPKPKMEAPKPKSPPPSSPKPSSDNSRDGKKKDKKN